MIASTGLIGATGSFLLTQAYRLAEANIVTPFEYVSILLGTLFGWWIWDEVPTAIHAMPAWRSSSAPGSTCCAASRRRGVQCIGTNGEQRSLFFPELSCHAREGRGPSVSFFVSATNLQMPPSRA